MQRRHPSANKGKPSGSVGGKQVAAALQGMHWPLFNTVPLLDQIAGTETAQYRHAI